MSGPPIPPPPGLEIPVPPPHHHHAIHPPPPMPPHPAAMGIPQMVGNNSSNGGTFESASGEEEFDVASYVYNVGFIHTAWADTLLTVAPHPPLRLHALFASRSPVLYRYLSGQNNSPYHINMTTEDRNLTPMALSMALATLYGHQLDLSGCDLETAKGLMAAGCLLGLESVASSGYKVVLGLLNKENVAEILSFAIGCEDVDLTHAGPYPPFTNTLVASVIDFIVANLVVSPVDPQMREVVRKLPFNLFKHIVEHDKLQVKSHMERHAFAREMIKARAAGNQLYDESVVMAFGGGKNGVEVIRKPAGKKKALWKAGTNN
ncbi:hypothetical protein TRVA0_030S01398 [Trichomonascus vanleenenianus]|uniref:uncharacterized protein n=1 Tax=Trichomonascus vanleenenianus TaxID=2268995 RepID=UPI003ECABDE9